MLAITSIQDVAEVLEGINHPLASKWNKNDLIKKNLATSYDYWQEDTLIPLTLEEFVLEYLKLGPHLGGIFSQYNQDNDI